MANTVITAAPGSPLVIATRTINTPGEYVFKAVNDPLLAPHWWGPRTQSTKDHKLAECLR